MGNPQIGDTRVNENGAEQVYIWDMFGENIGWRDTRKQMESQRWEYRCSDCGRKEYIASGMYSDEWFAKIAESEHKAPITYVKECEKCLDDKYGKEED